MPTKKARAKKVVEEEVEPEEADRDFTVYVEKDTTPKQERFIDWILRVTEYEPEDEDDFRMGAKLGQVLYMYYQRSDENQQILADARAAREEARANPKPKGKRGRPAKVVEPDDEDDVDMDADDEEEAPPARRKAATRKPAAATRKPAAKAGAAKRTPRRATKAVAAKGDAAPF